MSSNTTIKYTNNHNIPLPLAVWLATDNYDYEPGVISATQLLKPTRELILRKRVPDPDRTLDVQDRIKSAMGTAFHDAVESAWKGNYQKALEELGYSSEVYDNIVINPPKDAELSEDAIPLYMEQRHYRKLVVNGEEFVISGKVDLIANGILHDYKRTGAFTFVHDIKDEDYILQGSIYRWLVPDLIEEDYVKICFLFDSWEHYKAGVQKGYPEQPCLSKNYDLLSLDETEHFITNKLAELQQQKDMPQHELMFCNDKELWRKPTVYKWWAKEQSMHEGKQCQKNFQTDLEAAMQQVQEKGGAYKKIPGEVVACNYCGAKTVCQQKDIYVENGSLTLK